MIEIMGKIRLGIYPYTYARISAMKSKLIRKEDYQKILKMKQNEIAKYLQETEYKKEIDEMAILHKGIEKIEMGLNRNLSRAFLKLKRISDGNLRLLVDAYLRRKDVENLKTIFRGKYTKTKNEEIQSMLIPAGSLNENVLNSLIKKESIEEIVKAIKLIDLSEAYEHFRKTNNLFEIENALDRHYYEEII